MKNTTITLLGLSLCALAPLSLAQEPAPAPEAAPAPAAETPTPAAETPAPAAETPAPAAETPAPAAETPAPAAETPAPAAETPAPAAETPAQPSETEVKTVISYFLGHQTGSQFATGGEGPMKIDDIDKDVFFKALEDGMNNRVDPEIENKDLEACIMAFRTMLENRNKALSEANLAAGKAFLAENAKKEGVVTTESGLQYKVITPSDGAKYDPKKDGENAKALITYEGRLLDGTIFDKNENEPFPIAVNEVVPGFSEALKLMPVGAEWELYIPSNLAYGEHGPGILGSNATLIFKLKLHGFTPGEPRRGSTENPREMSPELMQQLQEAGLQMIEQ